MLTKKRIHMNYLIQIKQKIIMKCLTWQQTDRYCKSNCISKKLCDTKWRRKKHDGKQMTLTLRRGSSPAHSSLSRNPKPGTFTVSSTVSLLILPKVSPIVSSITIFTLTTSWKCPQPSWPWQPSLWKVVCQRRLRTGIAAFPILYI